MKRNLLDNLLLSRLVHKLRFHMHKEVGLVLLLEILELQLLQIHLMGYILF